MMAGCENSETTQFISSFPNLDENLSQILDGPHFFGTFYKLLQNQWI